MVADVGGTSVDDATRRMMKFMFGNDLAKEYNVFGRHEKRKFKDLCLFNVVYGKNSLNTHTVIKPVVACSQRSLPTDKCVNIHVLF